jgi:hypothetical protein
MTIYERGATVVPIDRHRRRRRRMATPSERRQAREVAAFVEARDLSNQPLLVALALVAGRFPDITLDTALAGYVFRSLLVRTEGGNA